MKFQNNSIIFLFSLLFAGCALKTVVSPKKENLYYRVQCSILDSNFNFIRTLPGDAPCLFLPDGSYVHTEDGLTSKYSQQKDYDPRTIGLYKRDANGTILWHLSGYFHHGLDLDSDGNILALSSNTKSLIREKVRADMVQKISPQGKVLAQFSFFDHAAELFKLRDDIQWNNNFWSNEIDTFARRLAKFEFSHANSIYEVPPQARVYFQNAFYLVNDPVSAMCLGLDEKLNRIVWHYKMKPFSVTHDCQPLSDGSILYLENHGHLRDNDVRYARVIRVKESVEVFSFPQKDQNKDYFPAHTKGGVEIVPEGYLFSASDPTTSDTLLGFISESGKWVRKVRFPGQFQDIKILQHPEFLEKNMVR